MENLITVTLLKEKLGPYYVNKVLAKTRDLSYFQVYRALNGTSNDLKTIDKVQEAAKAAIAEKENLDATKASLANNR